MLAEARSLAGFPCVGAQLLRLGDNAIYRLVSAPVVAPGLSRANAELLLYAEEIDAANRRASGELSSAFTHLALIEAVSPLLPSEPED